MELGVSEEFAHKLATDRNMTDIKTLSHDEIASILGTSKDSEAFVPELIFLGRIAQIVSGNSNGWQNIGQQKL